MTDFLDQPAEFEWPEDRLAALGTTRDTLLIVLGLFVLTIALVWTWAALRTADVSTLDVHLIRPPRLGPPD